MPYINTIKFAGNDNSVKLSSEQKVTNSLEQKSEGESNKIAYMLGATALASVIALGIAGRKGKLGDKIQKILAGESKKLPVTKHTPQENAKDALGKLYDKVIEKAKNDGNVRRANIFEQCKNNIDSLDTRMTYANLLDALYKDLRIGNYSASGIVTKNIESVTSKETNLIKVINKNGWHYRLPKSRTSAKSVDRISVNALADENLIKALDDLIASGKVKGYYKTPDTSLNWLERHDPITIYLDEKADTATLEAVKTVCEKYIRSTDDVLLGNKFAKGMALQKSPDEQDIKMILQQAKEIDQTLEDILRTQFTDSTGKLVTSAGYIEAANRLIDLMKK